MDYPQWRGNVVLIQVRDSFSYEEVLLLRFWIGDEPLIK